MKAWLFLKQGKLAHEPRIGVAVGDRLESNVVPYHEGFHGFKDFRDALWYVQAGHDPILCRVEIEDPEDCPVTGDSMVVGGGMEVLWKYDIGRFIEDRAYEITGEFNIDRMEAAEIAGKRQGTSGYKVAYLTYLSAGGVHACADVLLSTGDRILEERVKRLVNE